MAFIKSNINVIYCIHGISHRGPYIFIITWCFLRSLLPLSHFFSLKVHIVYMQLSLLAIENNILIIYTINSLKLRWRFSQSLRNIQKYSVCYRRISMYLACLWSFQTYCNVNLFGIHRLTNKVFINFS
jgi:hypothetical protein